MASLPPGKRPRTAAACSFDESLDDLEVAVARISGAEPHSVSADQLRRLKELKHLLFRKEMEVDSLARAKKRARAAAEVVLPLDLLTHAFCRWISSTLSPRARRAVTSSSPSAAQ